MALTIASSVASKIEAMSRLAMEGRLAWHRFSVSVPTASVVKAWSKV
jgi:hypothetical protein